MIYSNWIALADISLANGAELYLIQRESARPLYVSFLSLSGLFGTGINNYCWKKIVNIFAFKSATFFIPKHYRSQDASLDGKET